ncbi:MAG: hypothetical protein HYX32_03910 [Actinobacteria bacterium]|nr:hypothetical protein [Actinomycetota bacterium]
MSDATNPRELLDAFLDSELTEAEERTVHDWLATNASGRAELGALRDVRDMVRSLPPVDPPFGFYERMLLDGRVDAASDRPPARATASAIPATATPKRARRRNLVGGTIGAIVAIAAALVLVLGITPVTDKIVPPVSAYADRHDAMAEPATSAAASGDYESVPASQLDSMQPPFLAPADVAGFARVSGYRQGNVVHLMYRKGPLVVSIYEQRGDVDWDRIPSGGQQMVVGDNQAWETTDGRTGIMVMDLDGGMVLTVVTAAPAEEMMTVARSVPDPPDPSLIDHAIQHCSELVRGFTGGS